MQAACEQTAARLRRLKTAHNSQAADNQRLEAAASSARGFGCRALQQRMLLAADPSAVAALIRGQVRYACMTHNHVIIVMSSSLCNHHQHQQQSRTIRHSTHSLFHGRFPFLLFSVCVPSLS
jgi:hypothetical protein